MTKRLLDIKETDTIDTSIMYYEIPLELIPFEEFPLKVEQYKYGYARIISLKEFIPEDCEFDGGNILQIYNYFSNQSLDNINVLVKSDFLFSPVMFYGPPKRGKGKWRLIKKDLVPIERNEMPHLKNSPIYFKKSPESYIWTYCKNGLYSLQTVFETSYNNLRHLGDNAPMNEDSIRLRIAFELIRIESKKNNIQICNEDWIKIGVKTLKSSYIDISMILDTEVMIEDFIQRDIIGHWLKQPIYSEIPKEIRDKEKGDHN